MNNLCGYAMSKFFPNGFEWIDPKDFELNKYTSNNLKGCVLEVDLEYPRELRWKVTLTLKKLLYFGMCILELSKAK